MARRGHGGPRTGKGDEMTHKTRATSRTLALLLAGLAFVLVPLTASATGDFCHYFPAACDDTPKNPIPEPSSVALYGLGALLVSSALRRRNRR
jgi:hypothetical protein